jgi:hypothetical protein
MTRKAPDNGIANRAGSTLQHVSAAAGRGNRTTGHGLCVDGRRSIHDHEALGPTDQEVAGSNPAERTLKPQARGGAAERSVVSNGNVDNGIANRA